MSAAALPRADFASLADLLAARVRRGAGDACWLWTGRPKKDGFGQFRWNGGNYLPHRVAWELQNGPVPPRFGVTHSCGEHLCCNPAHLTLRSLSTVGRLCRRVATLEESLMQSVKKGGTNDCWPWRGVVWGRQPWAYGKLTFHGKAYKAHRAAYECFKGPPDPNKEVCHSCDNPICCNPAHLFLGSRLDNNNDMVTKRRHIHGERHPFALLSEEKVRAIRTTDKTPVEVAQEFGVTAKQIRKIRRVDAWRHV